ncbi:MAG: DUF4097 family beta strand repeat protein, partial [bacterium]|nr:DUF4097 family beta strand repeat protein [bacterium]
MGLKKIGLVKVVKILVISSVVSLVLLGLLILIFDIPSNFTGGRGVGNLDPKNTISVDVEKTYKIDDINDIEVDLSFSDIDVTVTDGDTISFIYTGSINSRPVLKEPYLKFTETRGKLNIETIWKGNYRIFNSSLVLKISIPENGLDNLNLSTSSGGIIVIGDVSDELRINTSSGKAAVNGFSGSLLRSNSSSGDHDFINIQT